MTHYAAFDVSDKQTAIHVLDEHGNLVWKGKRPSEPWRRSTAAPRPRVGARGPEDGPARAVAGLSQTRRQPAEGVILPRFHALFVTGSPKQTVSSRFCSQTIQGFEAMLWLRK